MISVVNGYVCTSSCEAAKAKHGEDPHKKPGELPDPTKANKPFDDPAVVFGGALKALPASAAITDAVQQTQPQIDIFA